MTSSKRMQKCPHCDGSIARSTKEQSCTVGTTRFVARVPAFSCRKCRALFLLGRSLERFELEAACVIALRASPNGERLRFLRKTLGMRAIALAGLLQVTAETLSRWEHDQRGIDVNAWLTVGSLVLEKAKRAPQTLERLQALAKSGDLPATIRVPVSAELPKLGVKLTRGSAGASRTGARIARASAT